MILKLMNNILIILAFYLPNLAYGFSDECPNANRALVFANGMFNSLREIEISNNQLQQTFKDRFTKYFVAYNIDDNSLYQLLKVFDQKRHSTEKFLWSYFLTFDGPEWFNDAIKDQVEKMTREKYISDPVLQKHIQLYEKLLDDGYRMVILPHSQGNFYVNEAIDFLDGKRGKEIIDRNISVIPVASPDDHIPTLSQEYVTLLSDWLIRSIPMALRPNTENINPGPFDHEFVENYLNGSPSGAKIKDFVNSKINEVSPEWSDDSFGAEYWQAGFLHRSLIPMRNWMLIVENQEPQKKLQIHECVAISLFLQQEYYFGEKCEKRSFDEIVKSAENCFKKEWSHDQNLDAYDCPLPGVMSNLFMQVYDSSTSDSFFGQHPECEFKQNEVHTELTQETLDKALQFIKDPH